MPFHALSRTSYQSVPPAWLSRIVCPNDLGGSVVTLGKLYLGFFDTTVTVFLSVQASPAIILVVVVVLCLGPALLFGLIESLGFVLLFALVGSL